MFHMSFTYVLHARPLRICIRTPSSAPIDRSPGGFWDSANLLGILLTVSTNPTSPKADGDFTVLDIVCAYNI